MTKILKTATKKLILTQKGEVNKNFTKALICASYNPKENKIYACRWMRSGRKFACTDNTKYILDVLTAQGYKYEEGNDAPKGGLEGNYIKVSKVAFEFLQSFRQWK